MIRKVPPALTLGVAALWIGTVAGQQYPGNLSLNDPAIQYHRASEADPVARLADRLGRGGAVLQFRQDGTGYLASALTQLGITVDSQVLVFSKTSMQAARISPRNPRAIYFTDDVAVGFVRGGNVLEFAAVNPQQGVMFYTLPNQDPAEEPVLSRRGGCLRCHQGPATAGVPGMFVSSVYPRASGFPSRLGAIVTDHRTAFEDRWGGWYVNGHTGTMRHRGNAVVRNLDRPDTLDLEGAANLLDLHRKIDPAGYLSPVSDIVALMTLEHQTQMTNLLTRLGWRARIARHGSSRDVTSRSLTSDITDLVAYMLFVDEPLLKEPVTGASSFARTFVRRGPRDNRGRSLREFDLTRRLFRYPLSYMVYSAAFDALPDDMRNEVYGLLFDVLVGKTRHPRFTRLPVDDRMAILEIVRDTKSDLPLYWREIAPSVTIGRISDVATRPVSCKLTLQRVVSPAGSSCRP